MNALTDLPPAALDHVAQYFRTLSEPTRRRRRALGVEKRPGAGNNPAAVAEIGRASCRERVSCCV